MTLRVNVVRRETIREVREEGRYVTDTGHRREILPTRRERLGQRIRALDDRESDRPKHRSEPGHDQQSTPRERR
jgi:hypothetical protein